MSYENFDPKDLLIESYSTKPSGFVHRIPHGIRAVHLPTGTVVAFDTDRSQHRNRHLALTELWEKVQGKPTYQELKTERDALVAQVAGLISVFQSMAESHLEDGEIEAADQFLMHIRKTPQQHLREIKAEAGRAGFVAGYRAFSLHDTKSSCKVKADEYADRVKAGEV